MRLSALVFVLTAAIGGASPAIAHEVTSKGVTVAHPWTRATPGGAKVGAAFMEIRADKGIEDKLISATSPAAGRVEIHTHIMDGDVMKMRRIESLPLKAGASHVLKPMGDHIMLFDLKQPLKEGEIIKMTLTFEKAGPIEVEGSVEPAGAMGPHGFDAQPGTNAGKSDTGKSDSGKAGHQHHHH